MRTTLTLDEDVVESLKKLASRSETSFKAVVNETLRRGLRAQDKTGRKRFKVETFKSAFQPGIDPEKLGQLVDELEVEDFARETSSGR